jgi:hypothetical protein
MAKERARDLVFGEPDNEVLKARREGGWKMVAIEWERDAAATAAGGAFVPVPFGLRVASDCRGLEPEPSETEVLSTVMRMVVQEQRLPAIAAELNGRGFRTRDGAQWNPASVFDLMPRLIDAGPAIFASSDWPVRRRSPAGPEAQS